MRGVVHVILTHYVKTCFQIYCVQCENTILLRNVMSFSFMSKCDDGKIMLGSLIIVLLAFSKDVKDCIQLSTGI